MNDSSPDPITIRDATMGDAESIAVIYNHYVHQGGATFDNQPWSIAQPAKLIDGMKKGVWLVAIDGDTMLGWASARPFSDRFGFQHSLELAIYADHRFTCRGIGSRLYQQLEQRCRDDNVHHLVSRVIGGNQASLDFHERHGFAVVGVQNEIGCMAEGQWLDLIIFQKLLSP